MLGVKGMLNVTPEQTALTFPAVKVGIGLIVTCKVSFTAAQGPIGSFVVKIISSPPAEIAAALGVKVVLRELAFEKDPLPGVTVVHVELVAAPPIIPCKLTSDPLHIEVSFPAFTVGFGLNKMILSSETDGQGLIVPVALSVNTTLPLVPKDGMYVAFKVFAFGRKDPPVGEDCHVPPVAPPDTSPFNETEDP